MKTIIILLLSIKAAYLFELNSTNHINKGFISNGVQYNPAEFPYVVTIKSYDQPEKMTYMTCTGSLITEYYVITAAHCTFKKRLSLIEIYSGSALNNYDWHRVKKGHMHGAYDLKKFPKVSDISLLKLETPFSNVKKFIKIGGHPDEFANLKSVKCTCIGFGLINDKNVMGEEGRRMDTDVRYGEEACAAQFGDPSWKEYLCSVTGTRTMTCGGDSGGPMICNGKLYGICAFMRSIKEEGHPVCGGSDMQSVHTFLYVYLKWINNIIDPPNVKENDDDNDDKHDKKKKRKKKKKKNSGNSLEPHLTMHTILTILFCIMCRLLF